MGTNEQGESPISFAARAAKIVSEHLRALGLTTADAVVEVCALEEGADCSGQILAARQGYGYLFTDGYPISKEVDEGGEWELFKSFRLTLCLEWVEVVREEFHGHLAHFMADND